MNTTTVKFSEQKLCWHQVRYRTYSDASRVCRTARHGGGSRLKPFRCDLCQGYHLGKPVRHR